MTRRLLLAGTVAAALLAPAGSASAAVCAAPDVPGGEWPFYSGTLDGHREQLAETTITTLNASQLGVAWQRPAPDGGVIHNTPVVVDGCVFSGTDLGTAFAANADTGEIVWTRRIAEGSGSNAFEGAGVVGSPAVLDGRVYVAATTPTGGVLSALDQTTGAILWQTVIDDDDGSGLDSSPVPFNGMIFQAFKGDESSTHSNPGFAIVDRASGAILKKTFVIPPSDYANGYRGGSIINTPTIDLASKRIYAGTGNPASRFQHERTNSLIKIDGDPASPTFGEILDFVRGTSDSYPLPSDLPDTPLCQREQQWPVGAFTCGQWDFNFLASPNLWTNSQGRQMFGGLQKSGVYTAVYTDTMEIAWQATLGPPCFGCNLSSTAASPDGIFVAVSGGNLYSLNRDTGAVRWAVPLTGSFRYNGVAVANRVVYSLNDAVGTLQAFNAVTGQPLLTHPFTLDTDTPMHDMGNSSGVSIARNTVFATSQWEGTSTLFALKLGAGGGGGGGPELPPPPPLPAPPSGQGINAQIATGPGAASYGYVTAASVMTAGARASYTNGDIARHNVVASQRGPDGLPLFQSALASTGQTVPVTGVEKLAAGTYQFFCAPHPNMKGQLIVR